MSIYRERLDKIRGAMAEHDIDLLFLPPSPYMYHATGIHELFFPLIKVPGDWLGGVLVSHNRPPIFMVQWMLARHVEMDATDVVETRTLEDGVDPFDLLSAVLTEFTGTVRRLGVADQTWVRTVEALRTALPEAAIVTCGSFLDRLLAVKDDDALRRMQRAAAITDEAHPDVLSRLRLGMTVRDAALEVDYQLRRHGADDNSFQTGIVFTRPDGPPSGPQRTLAPGDSITFDYGCRAVGYSSDFGRAAFAGDPPAEYRRVHEIVLAAQAAGLAAMKAGRVTGADVDAAARGVIVDAGYGSNFTHRLGHGIGIKVHERPFLDAGDDTVLEEGMTFTVEPSIRVPGRFANRVEDVVLVTPTGGRFLNHCPRDLFIIA